jgi:uncharacterized protein (TIGR03435 family)
MPRSTILAALATCLSCAAVAQPALTQPAFEVASIKPSNPTEGGVTAGLHIDGSQVRVAAMSFKDYLGMAYRVRAYQIIGPDWLAEQRFDLAATLPAGSSTAQFSDMMQALLAERFNLKLHHDKKEFPVYVLEAGKTPLKLQASKPDPSVDDAEPKGTANIAASGSNQGVSVNLGQGSSYTFANNRFEATKLTMVQFAGNLERFVDRPIVDMTGLDGRYDFALDLTEEDYRIMLIRAGVNSGVTLPPAALRLLENGAPVSLFDALQKLGLKLDARKAPLDVLVIDEARKTPTDN